MTLFVVIVFHNNFGVKALRQLLYECSLSLVLLFFDRFFWCLQKMVDIMANDIDMDSDTEVEVIEEIFKKTPLE